MENCDQIVFGDDRRIAFKNFEGIDLSIRRVNFPPAMHHSGGPGISQKAIRAGVADLIDLARGDYAGDKIVRQSRGCGAEGKRHRVVGGAFGEFPFVADADGSSRRRVIAGSEPFHQFSHVLLHVQREVDNRAARFHSHVFQSREGFQADEIQHRRICSSFNDRLQHHPSALVVGTDEAGEKNISQVDTKGPTAWVMGAEGDGMRRLTRENCDVLVRIPMMGSVESLNVSVATGVCLYETVRQRHSKNS